MRRKFPQQHNKKILYSHGQPFCTQIPPEWRCLFTRLMDSPVQSCSGGNSDAGLWLVFGLFNLPGQDSSHPFPIRSLTSTLLPCQALSVPFSVLIFVQVAKPVRQDPGAQIPEELLFSPETQQTVRIPTDTVRSLNQLCALLIQAIISHTTFQLT